MVFILEFFSSKTGIIILLLVGGWFWYGHEVNKAVENAAIKANIVRHEIIQKYEDKDKAANETQKVEVATAYANGQANMRNKLNAISKKVTKVADSQCPITTGFMHGSGSASRGHAKPGRSRRP